MAGRRANGEGSIYRRSDGRWCGSAYVDTVGGQRKRVHVYGTTRHAVHDRLSRKMAANRQGIRTPDHAWTVGAYLDYWLSTVVNVRNRPRTRELYASTVALHLKPQLGTTRLEKLSVQQVQTLLNAHLNQGRTSRSLQLIRGVLRTALSRAEREELVVRNVAKLVDLPTWERKSIRPWTADEARTFLRAAEGHRWYGAFLMLLIYGMRRGEVLGLRWCDIDLDQGQLHIRQQLQRVGAVLQCGPVKTAAGRRDLPLVTELRRLLIQLRVRRASTDSELVFLSSTGTPIDPKNFVRTFHEIRGEAGLPRITVHHTRHTAATLLKNLGVPARDAQLILGHAHVTTTQQLYQHGDTTKQAQALSQMERQLLTARTAAKTAVNWNFSTGEGAIFRALTPGGPGGARTLDTLLKSHILSEIYDFLTPVVSRVRARALNHILGWTAVKNCCTTNSVELSFSDANDWIDVMHVIENAKIANSRRRRFTHGFLK